jgi:phosphoenolpyruvate synthase/pyruvate phosphate dikinase
LEQVKRIEEWESNSAEVLGGKGKSLVKLQESGFNTSDGVILSSEVFKEYLKANEILSQVKQLSEDLNRDNFREKGEQIRELILQGEIQNQEEILSELESLDPLYAVRSSSVSEDSDSSSFAGMHHTGLEVTDSEVLDEIKKCWASLFSDRAIIYRLTKKLKPYEEMAVIVQEMVDADISGVLFTENPDGSDEIYIESAEGLGEKLVSGEITPAKAKLERENLEIIKQETGLSSSELKELAEKSLEIEEQFGSPQDIEWCIKDGEIFFLQSRPITGDMNEN